MTEDDVLLLLLDFEAGRFDDPDEYLALNWEEREWIHLWSCEDLPDN